MGGLGFLLIIFGIFISPIIFITAGLILIFKKELATKTNMLLTQFLWIFSIPLIILTALIPESWILYAVPAIGALSLIVLNKESLSQYRKYYGGLLIFSAIFAVIVFFYFYLRFSPG